MVKLGLLVRLEAKPGKETEVDEFLTGALDLVMDEPMTTTWFAIRMGESTFGIFDAFEEKQGREDHLAGKVAEALMARAPELFKHPPAIELVDVLAAKLPKNAG